jgi:hypothetical protein
LLPKLISHADEVVELRNDARYCHLAGIRETTAPMLGAQRKAPNREQRSNDKADPRNNHGHGMGSNLHGPPFKILQPCKIATNAKMSAVINA